MRQVINDIHSQYGKIDYMFNNAGIAMIGEVRDTSLEYWQRIIDKCYKRGFRKLLVEEDFPNQLSTMEIYTLTNAITKMFTKTLKVAFVDRQSEHNDLNLFGETVAVNRGAYGRIFTNSKDAEIWLMSPPD